ncbi:hypothetical protein ASNO1_27920 [Corallococcus caeni]|uniref:Uncharacterized protein n=1 Tax=Corallococcus caeni TaxID=3082388 RepID=A0ABQ6QS86_9BACT|nr:hypothetical protein ASNO1_27920 [Corallococcus sp. NO1]
MRGEPRREGHPRQRGVEALKTTHRPSSGSCRDLMGVQRYLARAPIRWRFGVDSARQKLGKSYPLMAQAAGQKAAA